MSSSSSSLSHFNPVVRVVIVFLFLVALKGGLCWEVIKMLFLEGLKETSLPRSLPPAMAVAHLFSSFRLAVSFFSGLLFFGTFHPPSFAFAASFISASH